MIFVHLSTRGNSSLTSLQQRLVKTGGSLIKHGPVLLDHAGREPSHTAAVWEHGAGGGDGVDGGDEHSEIRVTRALWQETCLWNALKIQDFPVLDFAGRVTTPPCGTDDGSERK